MTLLRKYSQLEMHEYWPSTLTNRRCTHHRDQHKIKGLSEIRDIISDAPPRSKVGKAKQQRFERSLNEAIVEFPQFDLVSMTNGQ